MRGRSLLIGALCLIVLLAGGWWSRKASLPATTSGGRRAASPPGAPQSAAPEMILSVNHSTQPTIIPGTPLLLEIMIHNGPASRAILAAASRARLQKDLDAQVQARALTRQQADAQLKRRSIPAPVSSVVITVEAEGFSFSSGSSSAGALLPWRPKIVSPTSPARVTLDGTQTSYVTFTVAPEETASTMRGPYALRASFEARSPGQWQGKIISNPVTVTVVDAPGTATVAERKADDLLRAEYFLALKDHDHAIAAAQDVLSLDPRSIDGSFVLGTVQEGKDDLQSALGAYETALTRFHDRYPGDDPPEALLQAVRRVRDKLGIKLAPIVESQ
jgi:hypothetical protein